MQGEVRFDCEILYPQRVLNDCSNSWIFGDDWNRSFKMFQGTRESIFTPVTNEFTDDQLDWRMPNRGRIEALIEQSRSNLILNFSAKTRHQITKLQDQVDTILVMHFSHQC
jgi:hypothetical protein